MNNYSHTSLARTIANYFFDIPQVSAIALGGSSTVHTSSTDSDIDLYIFTTDLIPLEIRREILERRGAARADLNLDYWDLGDEWFDRPTGIEVDVIYWDTGWIRDQIDLVLIHHQPSIGYSTCHWHTIRNALLLLDRDGWFAALKVRCQQPYPERLQEAIIARNFPLLRDVIPSYANQIEKALRRKDLVSINHRLAAFLASYFDILFAINKIPHPGEKRLIQHTRNLCRQVPKRMESQINRLIAITHQCSDETMELLNDLVDDLQSLMEQNNLGNLNF